jgi:hypothetical protein
MTAPTPIMRMFGWAAVFILAWFAADSLGALVVSGDTLALVGEVDRMLAAIKAGHPTAWGGQMPLLQQIPATFLKLAGLADAMAARWLAVLSLIAFVALLARAILRLRVVSSRVAAFVAAVLLSGPLLWYARASFGEMLAALFTLGFAVQCREGNSDRLLFAEGLLAGISKETAFPFLVLLGASASFGTGERWTDRAFRSRRFKVLVLTASVSLIVNAAFNLLRFGTPLNRSYVDARYVVSSLERQASYFLGLWFSPNGGLLFFWPSFVLLLVLSAQQVARRWRAAADWPTRLGLASPLAGICIALLGLTLGFSRWAFPMGWICWGPRFFIPWIPAFAYVLAASYARPLDSILEEWSLRPWKGWCVGIALAIASIPQFEIPFDGGIIPRFFAPDANFPKAAIIQDDPDYYFRYIDHLMWRKGSVLREGYRALRPIPSPKTLAMIGDFLFVWMLVVARPNRANRAD